MIKIVILSQNTGTITLMSFNSLWLKSHLIRNTFWATSGNALMAVVSFCSSIFVIRNLGAAQFGVLQEMLAYFLIIQNFENIINPNIFKKKIIENPEDAEDFIATMGLSISLIGVLFILGLSILYWVGLLPSKFLVLLVLLTAMPFRYSNGISFYFDAKLQTIRGQISQNTGNLVASIYKVIASFLNPVALAQAISMPLQYLSAMLIHILQYKKEKTTNRKNKIRFNEFSVMVWASFPLFLSSFVDLLKDRLPFIYLGSTKTALELGLFSAGTKLVEPWLFLASAISISFWPKLVQTKNLDAKKYTETVHLYFSSIFYIFFILAFLIFIAADFFTLNILGPQYSGTGIVLRIQAFALLFQAINVGVGILEINQGLTKFSLIRNIISLSISLFLLLILAPRYGGTGASIAILLSSFTSAVVIPLCFTKPRWIVWQALIAPIHSIKILRSYLKFDL